MVKNDEQGIFSVELGLNNWGALAVAGLAIQERPYKDEVGNMARAVLVFRENMVKADQLAAEQELLVLGRQPVAGRLEHVLQVL